MALPAGRVGVKRTSVDWQGNAKGNGGSSDTYTKQQIDSKFGGLTFRDNEGTPQVKTADGEWVNFNSGGGIGFSIPADVLRTDLEFSKFTLIEGGYAISEGICYIDVTLSINDWGQGAIFIPYEADATEITNKVSFYSSIVKDTSRVPYLYGNENSKARIACGVDSSSVGQQLRLYGQFKIKEI